MGTALDHAGERVSQFDLFPGTGLLYSLALMCSPLLARCNEMA